MTRLIGYRWKSCEGLSQVVLINLFNFLFSKLVSSEQSGEVSTVNSEECLTEIYIFRDNKIWRGVFPVPLAIGSHLIPYRTQQLSLSALMVAFSGKSKSVPGTISFKYDTNAV